MGKNKIDIKKISNKNYLKATFSKRRKGLFRKATDLCSLSGAQIAIVAFSPGNKPFPFGHPSADTVIDRFLSEQTSCTVDNCDAEGVGSVDGDDDHEDSSQSKEDEEMGQSEDGVEEDKVTKHWWDEPIDDDFGLDELKKYRSLLVSLKENAASKLDEMNKRQLCTKDYLSAF